MCHKEEFCVVRISVPLLNMKQKKTTKDEQEEEASSILLVVVLRKEFFLVFGHQENAHVSRCHFRIICQLSFRSKSALAWP